MTTHLLAQESWTKEASLGLVNAQLSAYNQRNIEAFVQPFSDSVKVFLHPDQMLYQGKEKFYNSYDQMFSGLDSLHCTVVNRMAFNEKTVIDQERIYGIQEGVEFSFEAIAIYKIWEGKIQEVYFIQGGK